MLRHFTNKENVPEEELINLFEIIDKDATGKTYDTSTVKMTKIMQDIPVRCSNKEALKTFFRNMTEEVIIKYDESNNMIGFVLFTEDSSYFSQLLEREVEGYCSEDTGFIAINFSGVHPDYQNNGHWTEMRDRIEQKAKNRENIKYIVTGTAKENSISKEANKSRGFKPVKKVSTIPQEETIVFVKTIK